MVLSSLSPFARRHVLLVLCLSSAHAFTPQDPSKFISSNTAAFVQVDAEVVQMPHFGRGSTGSTRTARDSAVLVEWERRTELERRIEDGIYYEHFDDSQTHQNRRTQRQSRWNAGGNEESSSVKGVFCGYRGTEEEYGRLKSANPDDF